MMKGWMVMRKKSFLKKSLSAISAIALSISAIGSPCMARPEADGENMTEFEFQDGQIIVTEGDYSGYEVDGTSLTITGGGSYAVSGSCTDGNITVKKGTTGVTLLLDGITLSSSDTAPICCGKSSGVSIMANSGTTNSLSDSVENNDENYPDNENAENAVIKCKDGSNVTIGGNGAVDLTANGKNGIKSGASTQEEGDASLTIEDLELKITASVNDAVNAGSLLDIKSGALEISAADDALHCDYSLYIGEQDVQAGPNIDISSCYEGIEGANVTIYSGDINVHSTDDGINAANSDLSDYRFTLEIAGGDVYVDAETGDGLDSNGTLAITGGKIEVFSSGSGDNAPFDSDGTFSITGGTAFAVGNSGMAQMPSEGSQKYISFGSFQPGGQPGSISGNNGKNDGDMPMQPGTASGNDMPVQPGAVSGNDNNMPVQPGTVSGNGINAPVQPGGQQNVGPGQDPSLTISAGDTLAITDGSNKQMYSSCAVRSANYVFYSDNAISENETYTLYVNGQAAATSTGGASPSVPSGPSGDVPGNQDGGSPAAPTSYNAANTYAEDTSISGKSLASTGKDENAVLVTGGNTVIKDSSIIRNSSDSTGGDDSSFYGIGAAALAISGNLYMKDDAIDTDAKGGAGVFAYGGGTAYVADTKISTEEDTSGGIHAAGGGRLYAWDLDVTTQGSSSAAIRSDRGGGTMAIDGGSYVSNGIGSPAVYCTADIAVNDASLTANNSEAVCIEGLNNLALYKSTLTGNMGDDAQNDTTWTVIIYQSMSGDSQEGCGTFTMVDGALKSTNGGLFYTTNTESKIYLENVDITAAEDSEFFLQCTGNANQRGWGASGSNGADCLFTAVSQEMDGDVIWDEISTLDFYITQGSVLKGCVIKNTNYSSDEGYARLYISSDSSWTVTGNSLVTDLYCAGTILDENGQAVSVIGDDGTVYVEGDSEYTVTVSNYSTDVDLGNAGTAKAWSDYSIDRPSQIASNQADDGDNPDREDGSSPQGRIALSSAATVALKKSSYVYTGKNIKPAVTVKIGSAILTKNTDYTVTYKNNKKVGTASVVVAGKGNYKGRVKKTFTIVPKKTSISGKITAKKKAFTVKWKKQTESTTGYQIQYSTSEAFRTSRAWSVFKKASVAKLTVKNLKPKKKYYVRIRTYKTVNGKKYYSGWSKVRRTKTK